MSQEPILEIKDLSFSYGKKSIFENISFSLKKGEITGLLGSNGAGKTTVFHSIIGLLQPKQGSIYFENTPIHKLPIYKRANLGLGYLAQEPSIFRNLTVEENLIAYLETMPLSKKERAQKLEQSLEELNLTAFAKKKAYLLSGGEKRRTEIARALIKNPKLMLLDEPFANIDPITIADVKELIFMLRDRGISTLITDHNAREIFSLVTSCVVLHGRSILASGSPQDLIANQEVRRSYLGEGFAQTL